MRVPSIVKNAHIELFPAVSIKEGRIVIVKDGSYQPIQDEEGRDISPVDFAHYVFEYFKTLLLIDIDGIENRQPQIKHIRGMADEGDIWLDAGIRYGEDILELADTGMNMIIIGTKTISDFSEIDIALDYSESLIFSIDYYNGILSYNPVIRTLTPHSIVKEVVNRGIETFIFSDIDGKKLREDIIQEIVSITPRLYIGGLPSLLTIPIIEELRVKGGILSIRELVEEI